MEEEVDLLLLVEDELAELSSSEEFHFLSLVEDELAELSAC